jgi:Aerotolerance regulator N-terminal
MGGLGLISSGFLAAGALLAAVPIVIHLLFRQKARRIDLGSLRFLRVAIRDNAHRRKVRRWLLLASRIAGVLLLGLLFARPYRVEPQVPGREREVAILIDRSASMGAGSADRTSCDRARQAASKLIAGLPEGTAVHLALFDEAGVEPVPSGNLDETKKRAGAAGTDFARALAWARDRVVSSNRKVREVHLFTDLQRSGLDHPSEADFPEGIEFDVIDVGRPIRANLAVVDARAVRAEIRPGSPPLVSALVFNAGPFPVRDVEVNLTLEGNGETYRLSEKVSIDGSSRKEVRFSPALKKPGFYRGTVALDPDDDLPFDDLRWLAFEAKKPESILLVDGEPGSTVYANETYYLEAALRLRIADAGPPSTPYEPRRIAWDGRTQWPSLSETQVVVLANVPDLPANVASMLRGFVEGGGSLVIFSGERNEPGSLASLRALGLLPADDEGTATGPFRFGSWSQDHPIFQPFADPQHGDLRSLLFLRIARLKPTQGSVVLASTNDGRPLLVEATVGQGRILQWAPAADNEWGDWAVQRLYLPLIHQMMGYLTGRLVGTGPIREAMTGSADSSGIEVVRGGMLIRNPDPSESKIERATLAEFRSRLRLPEARAKPPPDPPSMTEILPGSVKPGEFWKVIAWTLLVVLVVETFLANRTYA